MRDSVQRLSGYSYSGDDGNDYGRVHIDYSGPEPDIFAGAALGGGFGAVIGHLLGGPTGAVIGAAIFAALGAAIAEFIRHNKYRDFKSKC